MFDFSPDENPYFRCRLHTVACLQGPGGAGQVLHGHPDHVQAAHLQQRHPQPAATRARPPGQAERACEVPAARTRADRKGVGADVEEELREQ